MKKLFLLGVLVIFQMANSQTVIDLSNMTENITIGQNCSNSQEQEQFITNGDVNLNGFTVDLRNSLLSVNGNINGEGNIQGCGNSKVCKTGSIQNNPIFTNVEILDNCPTLSVPEYDFEKYGFNYEVYDLLGRLLQKGVTNSNTFHYLPSNVVVILKVDGFQPKKLIKN